MTAREREDRERVVYCTKRVPPLAEARQGVIYKYTNDFYAHGSERVVTRSDDIQQ